MRDRVLCIMRTNSKSWPIILLLGAAGLGYVAGDKEVVSGAGSGAVHLIKGGETVVRRIGVSCNIKGNISATGERIYHLPGQRYYSQTIISGIYGERYFCSEAEARRAGWRRAKV